MSLTLLPPSPEYIAWAWKAGELSYRLRNIQKKIRLECIKAHVNFLKFYIECTRRLGKSSYGLLWLSEDCIKNPGGMSAYFAPVKDGLRDYILPIIEKTFSDCPEEFKPTLDSGLTLTFPNGSKIIFRGSNNQTHRVRRGNAFRKAFIDEGRDVDDLDVLLESVVVPSLFSTDGRVCISSTPADTKDHPLYTIKQSAEKEGWYFKATINDCHRYDPSDFPQERINQWEKETLDKVAWMREYLAEWINDPTKIIIPEWSDEHVQTVERDEFFTYYHKYAALDSGVTDKTAGILGYYDFLKAKLIIEDEFFLQGEEVRTDRIAQLFKDKERLLEYQLIHDKKDDRYRAMAPNERVHLRVADNDNLILINDMNGKYDLDFVSTHKDALAAMINKVREWVKDGRILIDKRCTELLGCVRNGIWDKNREKLAKSKVYGHFDALMALVYLVRNIDESTNPIPKYYNKSYATHAIPMNANNQPQTQAATLARIFNVRTDRDNARDSFVKGRM